MSLSYILYVCVSTITIGNSCHNKLGITLEVSYAICILRNNKKHTKKIQVKIYEQADTFILLCKHTCVTYILCSYKRKCRIAGNLNYKA